MSIKTVNKAWSLLFDEAGTSTGDWIRYTEPAVSTVKVTGVFTDTDLHIRGWLVEAAVQASLLSSYGDAIRSLDPMNSYRYPLAGETASFTTTLSNGGVIPDTVDRSLGVYETTVPYVIDVVEGGYVITSINAVPVSLHIDTDSRMISLPFTTESAVGLVIPAGTTGTLSFSVTGKILPADTPLSIIRERALKAYPGNGFSRWPTLELMGWIVSTSLGGVNG